MSSCSHCRTLSKLSDEGSVLRLTHPLGHTRAKLRRVLAQQYAVQSSDHGLSVVVPPNALNDVAGLLEHHLSQSERESCQALLLAEGEVLSIDKMAQVQPLVALIAKIRSGWLVDMLNDDDFYAVFQPIVSASEPERAFAYECLLRGRDAQGQVIPPGLIFGAARSAGLLFHLDRTARLTAIRDAQRHGVATPIFINFNPTSIYDPAFCLKTTIQAIKDADISADRVVFEVIESDAVSDPAHLLNIVRFYREQGFRIAIDDFGAGYSSINLLTQLKPDFVKFDRELIRFIDEEPYKQKVLGKLIEMARELGVRTLAEGVEREEEFLWLRERGVDLFQGFFFARPASPPPQPQAVLTLEKPAATPLPTEGFDIDLDFSLDDRSLQGVLDSLNEQVAVIDRSGKIVMVNHAWRRVGGQESEGARFTGVNYLDVCRASAAAGELNALLSYEGILRVLNGQAPEFSLEYPCETPQGDRWFLMKVTPLTKGRSGAVVLHVDITERKRQEERISLLANYDQLTGAANRRHFYEQAHQRLETAQRELLPFSLLYLDLDGFKAINDRFGHACGDGLLQHVSGRLKGLLREGDLLARFGGDEFVILLSHVSSLEVGAVAARFNRTLEQPFALGAQTLTCSGSLGAASYPEHGRTVDELLQRADEAMYQAKARAGTLARAS